MYFHRFVNNNSLNLPLGKIVCIGRNYSEHASELNNSLPEKPLLFMKPSTALVTLASPIAIPSYSNDCQHEIEIALLIGKTINKNMSESEMISAIIGYAVALDLTLRDLQNKLKAQGHPWEIAKAFDGACPISSFIPMHDVDELNNLSFGLKVNGQQRQQGNTSQMQTKIPQLLKYIVEFFTLLPGDIVLTGTPAGVKTLQPGDELELSISDYEFKTSVLSYR